MVLNHIRIFSLLWLEYKINMTVVNWIKKKSSLCGSNFKYIYLNFIVYLYMLTDSEDGLKYPFQRNHIEAEFKVNNLGVVCGTSIHNYFTHIVLRGEQ